MKKDVIKFNLKTTGFVPILFKNDSGFWSPQFMTQFATLEDAKYLINEYKDFPERHPLFSNKVNEIDSQDDCILLLEKVDI